MKPEALFWVGCTSTFHVKDSVLSTIKLLNALNLNFTVLGSREKCCGLPLYQLGYFGELERTVASNVETVKELDVDLLISNCPACIDFMRNHYREFHGELPFKVLHISEYISENLDKLGLQGKEELNVCFHDPCHLARNLSAIEEPRLILKRVPGVNLIETNRNKLNTWCCGGSLRLSISQVSTTIAEKRILQIPRNVSCLVTSCPTCKINLRDGAMIATTIHETREIKVLDLVDLLADLIP